MSKNCAICGKQNWMYYPLCKKHLNLKNEGKVKKCETCGTWYLTDEGCPNCKTVTPTMPQEPVKETNQKNTSDPDELTCLICGKPSNGKHLCLHCYHRYKNKDILVKIAKCVFPCGEPLDESYEGVFPCLDGHIVKSMAEQTIDNYLCRHAIFHGYELPLPIGIGKEPLKPDFCLKNYLDDGTDVYIEYFGMEGDPEYDKKTAYKMPIYQEKGITLICLYRKTDGNNLEFALDQKLNKNEIKKGEINFKKA